MKLLNAYLNLQEFLLHFKRLGYLVALFFKLTKKEVTFLKFFNLVHIGLVVKLNVLLFDIERLLNGSFNAVGIDNRFVYIKGLVKKLHKDIIVFNVGDFKVQKTTVLPIDNLTILRTLSKMRQRSIFQITLNIFKAS